MEDREQWQVGGWSEWQEKKKIVGIESLFELHDVIPCILELLWYR